MRPSGTDDDDDGSVEKLAPVDMSVEEIGGTKTDDSGGSKSSTEDVYVDI
jgi:hypothetical protein